VGAPVVKRGADLIWCRFELKFDEDEQMKVICHALHRHHRPTALNTNVTISTQFLYTHFDF
jgi:hypothetical protein